jgi:pimeloyl-ACP methyl ester carboxylesterase
MLTQFLAQDWRWYMHLAVGASEHPPLDVSSISCPVTLVAGRHDVLTSMRSIVETAEHMPHAHVTVLPGSHFLPMEYPELVHAALDELARRSDVSRSA